MAENDSAHSMNVAQSSTNWNKVTVKEKLIRLTMNVEQIVFSQEVK